MRRASGFLLSIIAVLLLAQSSLCAQTQAGSSSPAPAQGQSAIFKPEELEQIVAPIALYPDALLAQVFMASTYPLEIVQAARWSKEHPDVKGDAVAKEMEKQTWDPAVKSLVAFPDVLVMMNENSTGRRSSAMRSWRSRRTSWTQCNVCEPRRRKRAT